MMKKTIFYSVLCSLFAFSCTDYNLEQAIKNNDSKTVVSYKRTPEEAREVVSDFVALMNDNVQTKSTGNASYQKYISSVSVLSKSTMQTRLVEDDTTIGIDTLMYAVNFSRENGFALVSADKRTEPIFALVDEGNLNFDKLKDEKNEMFLAFLDYAIKTQKEDIRSYNESIIEARATSKGWTIKTRCLPILKTKWGQDNPYGHYFPNNTAGCTVIAVAQILSHYQTISQVNWSYNGAGGASPIHWAQIMADNNRFNGTLSFATTPQSADEIAHLCRYLAVAFGAQYKDGETSVSEKKPIEWLNNWGHLKATPTRNYNERVIIDALRIGNPVYGRGNSGKKKVLGITVSYTGGHAWVFDGYLTAVRDGKEQTLIHCNWGWNGYRNGYYLSKVFNTNSGPEIEESETRSNNKRNYRYNLEYSIVYR